MTAVVATEVKCLAHLGYHGKRKTPYSVADPEFPLRGGRRSLGGANLRHGHQKAETYVKREVFGPVGGGGQSPTESTNGIQTGAPVLVLRPNLLT